VKTQTASIKRDGEPVIAVLIVEDEVLSRLVLAQYLHECGFRVYEAVNSEEALVILQSGEVSVHIVFGVVDMAGAMDGFALSRWITANRPDVRVLLASSHERSAELAGSLCEAGPTLQKPYEPDEVVTRIRNLLRG
jgi:DNA-binding response OmpR family regulator